MRFRPVLNCAPPLLSHQSICMPLKQQRAPTVDGLCLRIKTSVLPTRLACKQKARCPGRSLCRSNAFSSSPKTSLRLLQLPRNPHKNHRAHKCHYDLPDQSARVKSDQPEHKSANNPAEHPQDDVHHHTIAPPFITFPASQPAINPTTIQ